MTTASSIQPASPLRIFARASGVRQRRASKISAWRTVYLSCRTGASRSFITRHSSRLAGRPPGRHPANRRRIIGPDSTARPCLPPPRPILSAFGSIGFRLPLTAAQGRGVHPARGLVADGVLHVTLKLACMSLSRLACTVRSVSMSVANRIHDRLKELGRPFVVPLAGLFADLDDGEVAVEVD